MINRIAHVVGAGPAGLVAAINLARAGIKTIVHEQNDKVGKRFNGDFQGLENWSTMEDVLHFLASIGVSTNFRCDPYPVSEFFGPRDEKVILETSRALFYLVERGTNDWSIDQGLLRQAIEAGAEVAWNSKLTILPKDGDVIIGTGPKAADAIAKGIVFSTSHEDYSGGFFDDRIAPKAYAYLLVNRGRGTLATCLFKDFRNERLYFDRTLEKVRRITGVDIRDAREFGAFVNFFLTPRAAKNGRVYYVGESAGFQDALWGFGMRYAMLSGFLAARAIIERKSYDVLCDEFIRPMTHTSLANRWVFAMLGNGGYTRWIRKLGKSADPLEVLRGHYNPSPTKSVLFHVAKAWYRTRLVNKQCMHENCDCVWCRHGDHVQGLVEEASSCWVSDGSTAQTLQNMS